MYILLTSYLIYLPLHKQFPPHLPYLFMPNNLIVFTAEGLYCQQADLYIDPWKPVAKAILTHAHADHARPGTQYYLAHQDSATILRYRLGSHIRLETLTYGQQVTINGVEISLHPAGHIIGSAQVRLSYQGETWAVSGDYKLEEDGLSAPFEPVQCHTFITESTFGMPVYRWKDPAEVFGQWWRSNQQEGKASVVAAYALGKAQRILKNIDHSIGRVYVHGAVANVNEALLADGAVFEGGSRLTAQTDRETLRQSLIIAPPSALNSPWIHKLKPLSTGIASGWMNIRGARRRKAADRGFVLSDHADWPGLNRAIEATGASRVYVTHGYTASFSRWLREKGLEAYEVQTSYEGELAELNESAAE